MLGSHYRFQAKNATGQTITASSITVRTRRDKYGSDGSLTLEATEATVLSSGSTLANAAFLSGTTVDNTTDKWLGGTFIFAVTAPASAAGDVTLWLQHSTDGGTTWPDDGTGIQVANLTFATSGTKRAEFLL